VCGDTVTPAEPSCIGQSSLWPLALALGKVETANQLPLLMGAPHGLMQQRLPKPQRHPDMCTM
jgi:hypothetical protein